MSEERSSEALKAAAKVFLVNGALLVLSLAADVFKDEFSWLEGLGLRATFGAQIAIFAVTVLVAFLIHSGASIHEALVSGFAQLRSDIVEEIEQVERRSARFRDELAKGIIEYQGQSYRSLRYDPRAGVIYYGEVAASNRNVLFNNETVKRILQAAQREGSSSGSGGHPRESILYDLGFAASSRFAKQFQDHVANKHVAFELTAWLTEWTQYDSDAGFGHMSVEHIASEQETSQVVIKNSFLTHGADYGGPNSLCAFMIGYIEGLLKSFAAALYQDHGLDREGIRVEHDFSRDCLHGHQNPNLGCRFWVTVPKRPDR